MFENVKPVTLSGKAMEEVRKIMQTKNIPADYRLRVGVRGGGGCGGATFILGFDRPRESDLSYDVEDIPVVVDRKHTLYLIGKEIDFVDTADGRGFTFVDQPKVEK